MSEPEGIRVSKRMSELGLEPTWKMCFSKS